MATSSTESLELVLNDKELVQEIRNAKILLVGAGGIGCEVIKTMLLSGFTDFNVIDLDTIDVSNLNRQFLFNSTHVSKSKAVVAAEVAESRFAHRDIEGKTVNIKPHQGLIQEDQFDLDFFKSHTLVINALDNRAARSYVNCMCLDADVPLIESGSQGYLGQVYPIIKGASRCYDCNGQQSEGKTYAACTIRNHPSLPIHCIVWGKHLFAQLFGEPNADNDVSPDPTLKEEESESVTNGSASNDTQEKQQNGVKEAAKRESLREFAASHGYDPDIIFKRVFQDDIEYLLEMKDMWTNRRKPIPLYVQDIKAGIEPSSASTSSSSSSVQRNGQEPTSGLADQRIWSLKECFDVFSKSVSELKSRITSKDQFLVWDKDDTEALNFVTAVSNFRSHCFAIERKSRFDVKQMAGNIIPAIPSTNSIIGGLIALQAVTIIRQLMKLKKGQHSLPSLRETGLTSAQRQQHFDLCRETWINKVMVSEKKPLSLLTSLELEKPNANCQICPPVYKVEINLSFQTNSFFDLVEKILIPKLGFTDPEIYDDAGKSMLFSWPDFEDESEEEQEKMRNKPISDFAHGKKEFRLRVSDDDSQDAKIILKHDDQVMEVKVITEKPKVLPENEIQKDNGQEMIDDDDEDICEVTDSLLGPQNLPEVPVERKDSVKRPAAEVDSASKKRKV